MTLEVLRGNADIDFQDAILKKVNENQGESDFSSRFFYIVPNDARFNSEFQINSKIKNNENKKILLKPLETYSVNRLKWALYSEESKLKNPQISYIDLRILILQILHSANEKEGFSESFLSQKSNDSFVDILTNQLISFDFNSLSTEELIKIQNYFENTDKKKIVVKLSDIVLLFNKLKNRLKDNFLMALDYNNNFEEFLKQNDKGGNFYYFDGFDNFSMHEKNIIKILSEKNKVIVTFLGNSESRKETDFFYSLDQKIVDIANLIPDTIQKNLNENKNKLKYDKNSAPYVLEKIWKGENKKFSITSGSLNLAQTENINAEIERIALKIIEKVEKGDNFSDFFISSSDISKYELAIKNIFNKFEIPFVIDSSKKMSDHPFSYFLHDLLDNNYEKENFYKKILKIAKSGFIIPKDDDRENFFKNLNLLENYLETINFKSDWNNITDQNLSFFVDENQKEEVFLLKDFLWNQITKFNKNNLENIKSHQEFMMFLINWFEENNVDKNIISISSDKSELDSSRQIWNNFIKTIDVFLVLNKNNTFNLEDIIFLFDNSFSQSNFRQVPQENNLVEISNFDRSTTKMFKNVFFVGALEGFLPKKNIKTNYFNDTETIDLIKNKSLLKKDIISKEYYDDFDVQNINFYKFLTSSKSNIDISYPLLTGNKKINSPSPFLTKISKKLDVEIENFYEHPENKEEFFNYLGTPKSTLSHLTYLTKLFYNQSDNLDIFNLVKAIDLDSSISAGYNFEKKYNNNISKVDPKIVDKILKEHGPLSISAIQLYNKNPFEFYMRYILKIKEKNNNKADIAFYGNIYHNFLDKIFKENINKNIKDISYSDKELEEKFNSYTEEFIKKSNKFLVKNNTLKNYLDFYKNISISTFKSLINTSKERKMNLEIIQTELDVDSNNYSGKVDFIGKDEENGSGILIDYKNKLETLSVNNLDPEDEKFKSGISIQLPYYINALESKLKNLDIKSIDSAIFYPVNTSKKDLLKMAKGPEIFLEKNGGISLFDPKNSDGFYNDVPREIKGILEENYLLEKEKKLGNKSLTKKNIEDIKETATKIYNDSKNKIYEGYFPLKPFNLNNKTGLDYSPYKGVFNFDINLGDNYNDINKK